MPGLDLQSPPINTNRLAELLEWTHRLWGWLEANSNIILGKTAYGSSDTGMFAGDDSGTYKVDIGNDTHYFRFNGTVISFNSANASLSEDGVLTITNVVATDGNIGGFHLDSVEGLWSGEGPDRVQLKPDGGIWAGAELPENAPFYVDINGTSVLNATNITIGEEGFLRTKDKNSFDSLTDGIWVGFDNGYYKLRIGNANKYIEWDGVEMTIRGKLNASDIETGYLKADVIRAGTIVTNHVADDNITRVWGYYETDTIAITDPAYVATAWTESFIPAVAYDYVILTGSLFSIEDFNSDTDRVLLMMYIYDGIEIVLDGTFKWTASGSGTNEYYLTNEAGDDNGLNSFPSMHVAENSVAGGGTLLTEGTVGSLTAGQWDVGDNDTLGFDTIYVRLTDGANPDGKADGYLRACILIAYKTSGNLTYYMDDYSGVVNYEHSPDMVHNFTDTYKRNIMVAYRYDVISGALGAGSRYADDRSLVVIERRK